MVVLSSGVLDIPFQRLRPIEKFPGLHVNPIGLTLMLFLLTGTMLGVLGVCWGADVDTNADGEADADARIRACKHF